jgi:hypothetical protein
MAETSLAPQRYRKKPVVINALQWTGTNGNAVGTFLTDGDVEWSAEGELILLPTLEGTMSASPGDYIIRTSSSSTPPRPTHVQTALNVLWAAPGQGKSVAAASAPRPILVVSA